VFTAAHLERLEQITRGACADSETGLTEFNGEPSYVHLLVSFPPTVALSRLVNSLKGVSSRRMRQEFPGTGPALAAGEPAVIRVVLRRICRRGTGQRPAPVHRTAEPAPA